MADRRKKNKNSKKVLMISVGIIVLIVAVTMGIITSKGKSEEANKDIEIKKPTRIAAEQMVEYGDDIIDKTFTIHMEDGKQEINFADLDPEVDTMSVGKTEHQLELEDVIFDVTIVVEDTIKPVLKGLTDVIELEGGEVNIEELNKLITAEDPVDGKLHVTFEIKEEKDKEGNYIVTAEATDENDNKITETFKVVLKAVDKEEKAEEEITDKKDEKDKLSPVASKPKKETSKPKSAIQEQEKPKQEEPKKEEIKQEAPKKEKPKDEKTSEEIYDCGGGIRRFGDSTPNYPPLNDPKGSLPSGASLINKSKSYHEYSYNRSIPGGGSITEVAASYEVCYKSITILGEDDIGGSFIASYNVDMDEVSFTFFGERPTFTDPSYINIFYEVGRAFANAYGM